MLKRIQILGALALCAVIGFGLSACELAALGEAGLAGETAVAGEEAAAAAALGRAAFAGDAAALSRIGTGAGAAIDATEAASLSRVAAARIPARLGIAAPLTEEVATIRGGARVLSYSENYPLARSSDLTVRMPDGSVAGSIRRLGNRVVIRNSSGQVVGESVLTDNRIEHFTDSTHRTARGYSVLEGTTLRHWLYDESGRAIYFGSETVTPRSGIPPESVTIPAALLAGMHRRSRENGNPASASSPSQRGYVPTQLMNSQEMPFQRSVLRHDGVILNVRALGRPTLVWSDGYVDVWADRNSRHVVLAPGRRLRFPHSGVIHALPRSREATFLFSRPLAQ